jgi:hypothetical protein
MNKEFIPHEQALELKELGFKEECSAHYLDDDDLELKWKIYRNLSFNTNNCLQAPLYQQAFRFFREKYGVHMYPTKFDETKWWIEWGMWTSKVFNTFEEAELECLKKLIELSKNK